MKTRTKFGLLLTSTLLLVMGLAAAQDDRDDATDVWIAVEAQWAAEENGDDEWVQHMLADGFFGWDTNSPAPRSKTSTAMWDRFGEQLGSIVAHELYPLEIVLHGDTAIVHYLYSSAFKDKKDKIEMNKGRFTDILIRTDEGWKFLGWHGGDDD